MPVKDNFADPAKVAEALKRPRICDTCPYAERERELRGLCLKDEAERLVELGEDHGVRADVSDVEAVVACKVQAPGKVFVHIWDDNANVYADRESALNGIGEGIDDEFLGGLDDALDAAEHAGGDGIYLDGGMSTLRYLTIMEARA